MPSGTRFPFLVGCHWAAISGWVCDKGSFMGSALSAVVAMKRAHSPSFNEKVQSKLVLSRGLLQSASKNRLDHRVNASLEWFVVVATLLKQDEDGAMAY